MNSKERVVKQLNFEKTDRIPFNFWMDRRLMEKFNNKYGDYFRVEHYGADVIETFPLLAWPMGEGVERDGSYWFTKPAIENYNDTKSLKMPNPDDPKALSMIKNALEKWPDKAIFVNIPGPFTLMHPIRLMDNLFFDIYDNPEKLHEMIKKIMDIQNKIIRKVVKLPITAIYFQDDIASSNGLLMSIPHIKEFILDYMKEGIDIAKKNNKYVVYHSDGNVTDILDTLIDMKIDAINPMQPEHNDFEKFKNKYSKKLCVYGGIDNTKIIPNGTKQDIKNHIEYVYNTLGKTGGLIMSTHDIPFHCPLENIDYMVEQIKKLGL